jgi:hypothetical protein
MNTQPTPISDRIVSQFRKGEATSDGLILTMVELELKIAAICRERDEARAESIRWQSIAEGRGRTDDDEQLATITAQRDRLAEAMWDIANGTSCRECGGEDQALFARQALQSMICDALQSLTPNA